MSNNIDYLQEISNFVFTSKYARYDENKQRRETWPECVTRVAKMHHDKFKKDLDKDDLQIIKEVFRMVRDKKVVPSMRSMQFGGKAIDAKNERIYNCSTRHVDSIRAFSEIFFALLCGNGVGIGISRKFIKRLPPLVTPEDKNGTVINYVVEDTVEGWADTVDVLLSCYFKNTAFSGRKIVFDYSKIRKEGTPLITGGGKAPGYKGLKNCHIKIKQLLDHIIEDLKQTELKPINAYDILMHCSDAVLSGGIRRSASSTLFDIDDVEMINAKTFFNVDKHTKFVYDDEIDRYVGKVTVNKRRYDVTLTKFEKDEVEEKKHIGWIHIEPQRARSNNSAIVSRRTATLEQFKALIDKCRQFGEPGFAFVDDENTLYNPCFEIGMIPITEDGVCGMQFCNLSSVNGAKVESKEDFLKAVEAATIIGTLQASYTDFKYFRPATKEITEKEALLGVSITGIFDNPKILLDKEILEEASELAVNVNREWAKKIGINQAARVTCVKPEGSASLVMSSSSGCHPHHAHRYFRRVQANKHDNVYKFFKENNPQCCEESVWSANKTDDVITFPISIPETAKVKGDLSAIQHLRYIKRIQQNWVVPGTTEANEKNLHHNVSCTVIVKDEEWDDVINYIFNNRKYFAAVSLLPFVGDKIYNQAPNEAVVNEDDEKKWEEIVNKYTSVDFTKLKEDEDNTKLSETAACAGGACEVFIL